MITIGYTPVGIGGGSEGTGGPAPHFFQGTPDLIVCFNYNTSAYLKLNRPTFDIETQEEA